jgi:hypothetical protein
MEDSVFLFEESMAKGAKKDSRHIQTICSFILNKERGGIEEVGGRWPKLNFARP